MEIKWDVVGERRYETGVDHGVLYDPVDGVYVNGVPWNGLITVTESPSGAEATPIYADNMKYLNMTSAEDFNASLEAYTYPEEFEKCDGTASLAPGVTVGQQRRSPFGLAYRTLVGNDMVGTDLGYKLHLVYGAQAAPTEKARATVNESPEALTFNWSLSTTPVEVPGKRPSAHLTIDSTKVDPIKLKQLEDILYGTFATTARMPLPEEVADIFEESLTEVKPTKPTFAANKITIPVVTGVVYKINGVPKTGEVTILVDTLVVASPAKGYKFPAVTDVDWLFEKV